MAVAGVGDVKDKVIGIPQELDPWWELYLMELVHQVIEYSGTEGATLGGAVVEVSCVGESALLSVEGPPVG